MTAARDWTWAIVVLDLRGVRSAVSSGAEPRRPYTRLVGSGLAIVHVNDIAWVASTLQAAQRRRGDTVDLIDPPKPGASLRWPWKVLSIALRLPILAGTALAIRRRGYAIAHVHYATQALVGLLCTRPFVVHCHGTDVRGVVSGSLRGRALRALLRPAALVVYSTPDLEIDTRSVRSDAQFLPNPIDVATFAPAGPRSRDLLVGVRLDPVKGAETAIVAIELLLHDRPATTVTVVASGLLAPAARARLGGRVSFVEPRRHPDMPQLLASHRVALGQFRLGILSQFELESMACGTPIVATFRYAAAYDKPPPVEEASEPQAIARAVVGLLEDHERRERLARDGREWVIAHHDSDAIAARLDRLYRRALAS